jgi:preprotein translocase subunit SecE
LKNFIKFLHDSREELRKVTWPDRDEVTSFTGVVVVTVVFVSIFLWLVDSALMTLVKVVIK